MKIHPAVEVFPRLQEAEFAELVADIRQHGVLVPVLVQDGLILDGRHRWEACEQIGIDCPTVEWDGAGSIIDLVVSLNLKRRHLTASQRAAAAVEALPLYEEEAKKRQGARTDLRPELGGSSDGGKAATHAAKQFQVARGYVEDAKQIRERAPEDFAAIQKGDQTVSKAKSALKREDRISAIVERSADTATLDGKLGKFPLIYADPPWRYDYTKAESRAIENQYPTLPLEEISKLPVSDLCLDDAILFLWATSPKLKEALEVLRGWGFTYRTCMVWVKDKIGMGYYARQKHEILLIGTRGSPPTPLPANRPPSVIEAPRGEHSTKPIEFYDVIESMYPEFRGRWLELFQRRSRDDWTGWGFEA